MKCDMNRARLGPTALALVCMSAGVVTCGGGKAGGDGAVELFGAVYVLNPVDEGGVFAERRARMAEMLSFLPRELPVVMMGVSPPSPRQSAEQVP